MLKDLPEDVVLNISSFLLGTPQEYTLKQIQKKYSTSLI